ncbi:hypothetical protein VE23_03875 [Paenibacillus sp. D9]|uniref:TlpA family protein disulfide reductase n=1 Tax=Paenibacillus sp. D9 TaxID=665792 RepID=UPI00061FB07E|nr:TlpA disulfide reductase family protein [Paenibacillus sp. D9]KKC46446.1 hypothetical protein VE23_03875 [Paenibacillus sp. D9]
MNRGRFRFERRPKILLTLLLLAAALLATVATIADNRPQGTGASVKEGSAAPDIGVKSLTGESIHLSDYRGRAVLVHFWASWCVPCVTELPLISEAARSALTGNTTAVLAVNVGESRGTIREFMDANHIDMPVFVDITGEAVSAYRANALPTSILISPEGKIARIVQGQFQSVADIEKSLAEAL